MKILALVAARGGSKRVAGKNIRPLGGRPLIVWTLDAVRGVSGVCDTLVSTDDEAIASVAREAGALVPWLRPAALATDTATSVDVCLHALDWYERERGDVDGLLLLQPTSPFRRRDTIERGCALFAESSRRPVIGVAPAASHPMWCYRVEGTRMRPFVGDAGEARSQDLPPAYVINGAFYLIAPADLRAARSFLADNMAPLVVDRPGESVDIDTEWDWTLAEALLDPMRRSS